jgi:hypothetical protein
VTVEGTIRGFSFNNTGDRLKITNVSRWGTLRFSNATVVNGWFHGCSNLTITATDSPDLTGSTSATNVFSGCSSLTTIPNIDSWSWGNVTSFLLAFNGCTLLNEPSLSDIDISSATTISNMYLNCSALNQSFADYDMTNVLNASSAFRNCSSLNQSFTGTFTSTTGSVTTFAQTWEGCTVLNQSFAALSTGSANNFASMYKDCTALDQNFAALNVQNVTSANFMFENVTLSTSNYNATLVGWEAQAVQNNVVFVGGNSTYTAAGAAGTARAALIADHGLDRDWET